MIRRSTWILLALFIFVLAVAWGFQRYKTSQAAKVTPTTTSTEQLLQVQENTIVSLRVENDQGKAVVLGRNAEGLWTITEPQGGGQTDTAQAESAVTQLVSLQTQFSLGMPDNLAEYGLLKPAYTITLTLNGGEKHVILVGAEAPAVSGYYIQLDGSAPKVVNKSSLDPVLQMIGKPPYQATETPTPLPGASGTPGVGTPGGGTPGAAGEGNSTPASTATPAASLPADTPASTPTIATALPAETSTTYP